MEQLATEQELLNVWLDWLTRTAKKQGVPLHTVQIESGATALGIPDVFVMISDAAIWLEAKRESVLRAQITYRPAQQRFLQLLRRHRQLAATLVLKEDATFRLMPAYADAPITNTVVTTCHYEEFDLDCACAKILELIKEEQDEDNGRQKE